MKQKEKEDWFDYPRQEQDIEHSSQSMKDYPRWEEDEEEVKESASKAKKTDTNTGVTADQKTGCFCI